MPGKEAIFVFLLLALIIPYQALLTPIFLMFAKLKLTNTLIGLAIVHTAIQLPFSLYIMRNSFEAVPRELEEAAVMDGGSSWQILIKIFIPAVVPAIVTVTLFAFITSWNEFLGALVMMSKGSTFTLPVILAAARTETSLGGTDWGMLQAGMTISIIPCIAIYLLLQRYYVSGCSAEPSSDALRAGGGPAVQIADPQPSSAGAADRVGAISALRAARRGRRCDHRRLLGRSPGD